MVESIEAVSFRKIEYTDLNAKQKENFNYAKISAILADYGYITLRLSDDWLGADFIAKHIHDGTTLNVQLKSRLTFDKKYESKDLYIAFPYADEWYLYPHDELLRIVLESGIGETSSWLEKGGYSMPQPSREMQALLQKYKICGGTNPVE